MMEKLKTINIDERIALEITLCPNPPWYGSVHPPTMPLVETPNSQMFLVQVRLLKKCKFLIEKDHSEKEMAVQVNVFFDDNDSDDDDGNDDDGDFDDDDEEYKAYTRLSLTESSPLILNGNVIRVTNGQRHGCLV